MSKAMFNLVACTVLQSAEPRLGDLVSSWMWGEHVGEQDIGQTSLPAAGVRGLLIKRMKKAPIDTALALLSKYVEVALTSLELNELKDFAKMDKEEKKMTFMIEKADGKLGELGVSYSNTQMREKAVKAWKEEMAKNNKMKELEQRVQRMIAKEKARIEEEERRAKELRENQKLWHELEAEITKADKKYAVSGKKAWGEGGLGKEAWGSEYAWEMWKDRAQQGIAYMPEATYKDKIDDFRQELVAKLRVPTPLTTESSGESTPKI